MRYILVVVGTLLAIGAVIFLINHPANEVKDTSKVPIIQITPNH